MLPIFLVSLQAFTQQSQMQKSQTLISNDFDIYVSDKKIDIQFYSYYKKPSVHIEESHGIPAYIPELQEVSEKKRASSGSSLVDISSLNYHLLDSLVWIECNKYRISEKNAPCKWQGNIYKAARHHSEYMIWFSTLIHGENKTMTGKEKDREFYDKVRTLQGKIRYKHLNVNNIVLFFR